MIRLKNLVKKSAIKLTGQHPLFWLECVRRKVDYDWRTRTFKRIVLGQTMHLNGTDPGLSLALARNGIREPESVEFLRTQMTPDMNILDLGANIGFYVLLEAQALKGGRGRIIAVEPSETNLRLLELNVRKNGHGDKVTIIRGAASDSCGTTELAIFEYANCHRLARFAGKDLAVNIQTVDAFTLAEIVRMAGLRPEQLGLLRMDVEGAEYTILNSFLEELKNMESLLLFVEFHPSMENLNEHRALIRDLEAFGFASLCITKEFVKDGAVHRKHFPHATIKDLYSDETLLSPGGCETFLKK